MSYDDYQHDGGGVYEGRVRYGKKPKKAPLTDEQKAERARKAQGFLSSASSVVNDPGGSQDKGQDSLTSWATKKTGINLTNLPKLRITTKPGRWADSKKWKTKALKTIARKASKEAPKVPWNNKAYVAPLKAAIKAIKNTKRVLDAAKPLAERSGGEAAATYQKLALRWYEVTSGILRDTVVKSSGEEANVGLRLNIYPIVTGGVSYTAWNAAFASVGGARYAQALERDSRAFLAALRSPTSRTKAAVTRASTDAMEAVKESGGGGVLIGLAAVLAGILVVKKMKGRKA